MKNKLICQFVPPIVEEMFRTLNESLCILRSEIKNIGYLGDEMIKFEFRGETFQAIEPLEALFGFDLESDKSICLKALLKGEVMTVCKACKGTRKNSKGGTCIPCSIREQEESIKFSFKDQLEEIKRWQVEEMGNTCTICHGNNANTKCDACGWWGKVPPSLP